MYIYNDFKKKTISRTRTHAGTKSSQHPLHLTDRLRINVHTNICECEEREVATNDRQEPQTDNHL
jgi:hypothetical protein